MTGVIFTPLMQTSDQNSRRKQIFSRSLVEYKRLGRTLPSVINGMSASQAQRQGFIEDTTDAETASSANSESLFVDGDTDDDEMRSCSRSSSTQNELTVNGETPRFNPQAAPFNPFQTSTPAFLTGSTHSEISTFGKPSFPAPTTQPQATAESSLNGTLKFSNRLSSSNGIESGVSSKSAIFPGLQTSNSVHGDPTMSKETLEERTPSFNIKGAAHTPSLDNTKKQEPFSFTSARSQITQPGTFGLSPSTNSFKFPQSPHTSTSQAPITSTTALPDPPKSVLEPKPSNQAPNFSFRTSDLFKPDTDSQIFKFENNVPPLLSTEKPKQTSIFPASSTPEWPTSRSPATFESTTKSQASVTATPHFQISTPNASSNPIATISSQPALKIQGTSPFLSSNVNTPAQATTAFQPPQPSSLVPSSMVITSTPLQSKSAVNDSPKVLPGYSCPSSQTPTQFGTLTPSLSVSPTTSTAHQQNSTDLETNPTRSRSTTLETLTDALIFGDHGLLQQFIEYTVEPIIHSAVAQLEDEESWKEARQLPSDSLSMGESMLIGYRDKPCDLITQKVLQKMASQCLELRPPKQGKKSKEEPR